MRLRFITCQGRSAGRPPGGGTKLRHCALLIVLLLLSISPATAQKDDSPTLVIFGAGINSAGGERLATNVYRTLNWAGNAYRTVSIRFGDGKVERLGPTVTVVPDELKNRRREAAARTIGEEAANTDHAILHVDMQLEGTAIAVGKGLEGMSLLAGEELARKTLPIQMPVASKEFGAVIDGQRTKWNDETERAAVYIREAAEAFKTAHPNGHVIVIGHSAFTDAINLVRTTWHPIDKTTGKPSENEAQLIDQRVMLSTRVHALRYPDPQHTVFVTVPGDLPASNMGNVTSPQNIGELTEQGMVIQLPRTMAYLDPLEAHSAAQDISVEADLKVSMKIDGSVVTKSVRTIPGNLMWSALDDAAHNRPPDTMVKRLDTLTLRESKVGGVTLTKAADVLMNPRTIDRLELSGPPDYHASFRLHSGEHVALPPLSAPLAVAALKCVFLDPRPPEGPEINLRFGRNGAGSWQVPELLGDCLPGSPLGDALVMADLALARIYSGDTTDYRPPPIANYHPFAEVALDFDPHPQVPLNGRVWLAPTSISVSRSGDHLQVDNLRMAVFTEFWPAKRDRDYYAGKIEGQHLPAADFVALQLTANYSAIESEFGDLQRLHDIASYVGILLWARDHNVLPDRFSAERIRSAALRLKGHFPGAPQQVKQNFGNDKFDAIAVAPERKPTIETVSRPAVIFNEFGPTRFLWEDGTASRIEYRQGLIWRLTSRNDHQFIISRDAGGHAFALGEPGGRGIVMTRSGDMPIIWRDVHLNADGTAVTITRSTATFVSEEDIFDDKVAAWVLSESQNRTSLDWLLPPVAGFGNVLWQIGLAVALFLALMCAVLWRTVIAGPPPLPSTPPLPATPLIRTSGWIGRSSPYERLVGWSAKMWALRQLGSSNPDRRARALAKLQKMADPDVVAALIKTLPDPAVERTLVNIGAPSVTFLIALLPHESDSTSAVRLSAVRILQHIGGPSVGNALQHLLRSEWRADQIVEASGRNDQSLLALPSAIVGALRSLGWRARDVDGEILEAAIDPECRLKPGNETMERLILWFRTGPHFLRLGVARLFERMADPRSVECLIGALGEKSEIAALVVSALKRMDQAAVEPLVHALSSHQQLDIRKRAVEALGDIGEPGLSGLLTALKHSDLGVRQAAANLLSHKETTPQLTARLEDTLKDPATRQAVAEVIKPFVDALANSDPNADWGDRWVAAQSLGKLGPLAKSALPALIDALDVSPRPRDDTGNAERIREKAAWAISQIGDVHPELTEMFHSPAKSTRLKAVKALGCTGDPRAVAVLREGLREKDTEIRTRCMWALYQTGAPRKELVFTEIIPLFADENTDVRREAVRVLARAIDDWQCLDVPRCVGLLSQALHDRRREVRLHVAEVLAKAHDPRRIDMLSEALRDEDSEVRGRVVAALGNAKDELGRFDNPRVPELLLQALHDPQRDIRKQVVDVVERCFDLRRAELLSEALHDEDADIRLKTVEALARGEMKASGIDANATEPLARMLNDSDPRVVKKAAHALYYGTHLQWSPPDEMKPVLWAAGVPHWPLPDETKSPPLSAVPQPVGWFSRVRAWLKDFGNSGGPSPPAARPSGDHEFNPYKFLH